MVDAIEERSSEFEGSVACAADNRFTLVTSIQKLLLIGSLQ